MCTILQKTDDNNLKYNLMNQKQSFLHLALQDIDRRSLITLNCYAKQKYE